MRFLHTTYCLLHNTQRGFAPIALVILLLLGIAAGTLLVQQGINFLPKAADADLEACLQERCLGILQNISCKITDENYDQCVADNEASYKTCETSCTSTTHIPQTEGDSPIAAQSCEYEEWSDEYGDCETNGGNRCFNDWYLSPASDCQPSAKGPTALDPRARQDAHYHCDLSASCPQSTKCSSAEASDCRPQLCTKEQGQPKCYDHPPQTAPPPAAPANSTNVALKICAKEITDKCRAQALKSPAGELTGECYLIGDESKCMYKTDKCDANDIKFCRDLYKTDCEVETIKGSAGDLFYKFSRCVGVKAAPNAGSKPGTPASVIRTTTTAPAGANPASGTTTSTGVRTDCGEDANGLKIPCFKIGVFDEATLKATIEDARIARLNYDLYSGIITDLQKYVDTSQAAAKTAAAKAQADACISGTATTSSTTSTTTNTPASRTTPTPASNDPSGCSATFRPGRTDNVPCDPPKGYVCSTKQTTNSSGKKVCSLDTCEKTCVNNPF